MKTGEHAAKVERYWHTIEVLAGDGIDRNRETVVQACVLCSAEMVNEKLHKLGILPEEHTDLKHNMLFGFVKKIPGWENVAALHHELEDKKYKVVHGKTDGDSAKSAIDVLKLIGEALGKVG